MSAHTPGPWETVDRTESSRWVRAVGGATVGYATENGVITREASEANARLISAAPDLLEALTIAREYIRGLMNRHDFVWGDWSDSGLVDDAIAKAEGR